MRGIDTNVLVWLIVRDDPAQAEKVKAFVAQGAWVSQPGLVEQIERRARRRFSSAIVRS